MSIEEIGQKILDMSEAKQETDIYIDQLVVAMVDVDEEQKLVHVHYSGLPQTG